MSDFITQQYFTSSTDTGCLEAEAKYRLAELEAAVKYLLTLDWNVRDGAGVLVPRTSLEQKLRDFIGDQIQEPKLFMLARLVVDLLVKISMLPETTHQNTDGEAAADTLVIDDRPTVELMLQHPRWTVHLLATMGLAIDLPLPSSEGDTAERGCEHLHQGKGSKVAGTSLSSSASALFRSGGTTTPSGSPALPPSITPPTLSINFRVRHSPAAYLRFAELITRAA